MIPIRPPSPPNDCRRTATADVISKTAIAQRMNELETECSALRDVVATLEKQLTPVLRPTQPTAESNQVQQDRNPSSPMTNLLCDRIENVTSVRLRLMDVINGLEL